MHAWYVGSSSSNDQRGGRTHDEGDHGKIIRWLINRCVCVSILATLNLIIKESENGLTSTGILCNNNDVCKYTITYRAVPLGLLQVLWYCWFFI